MEWLDRHFIALPKEKKAFLAAIAFGYFLLGFIGYWSGLVNLVEALLIFVIGIIYTELLKLQYRIKDLEDNSVSSNKRRGKSKKRGRK